MERSFLEKFYTTSSTGRAIAHSRLKSGKKIMQFREKGLIERLKLLNVC